MRLNLESRISIQDQIMLLNLLPILHKPENSGN